MSMEIEVFSNRRLASTAEWQRALDAEQFRLRLDADVRLESVNGFFPMLLGGRLTGFECYHDDADAAMKELGQHNFNQRWRFALGLRWLGSNMDELEAAWMAATAYAASTQGVLFDFEQARILSLDEARGLVSQIVTDRPRMEAIIESIENKFSARGPSALE
jgi:hypothetical protein